MFLGAFGSPSNKAVCKDICVMLIYRRVTEDPVEIPKEQTYNFPRFPLFKVLPGICRAAKCIVKISNFFIKQFMYVIYLYSGT
jgi:hypothetical protein